MDPDTRMTEVAQDALREAFERHYVPLLRLAVLLTGRTEEGEEIVQEAFARAATRIGGIPPEERGPYLRTVVLNTWRTRARRASIEAKLRFRSDWDAVAHDGIEERDALWQALKQLPPRQRACLVLRFFEDLPDREIASLLRCSVGTVKSQVSRGLKRLREVYVDEG